MKVDSHRMKQCRVQTATIAISWSLIAGLTSACVADAAPTITDVAASKGDQTTQRFSASELKERAKQIELLVRRGDSRTAYRLANEVVSSDPKNAQFLYLRGFSLYHQKRREEAIADYTASLKIKPDIQVYKDRSYTYKMLGLMHKSLDDLRTVVKLRPAADPIADVATMEFETGDLDGCIRDAQKVVGMTSKATSNEDRIARVLASEMLGKAYLGKNNKAKAIECLNGGIQASLIGPNGKKITQPEANNKIGFRFQNLYLLRGEAYEKSGKLKEAMKDYENIVSLSPKRTTAKRSLLRLYMKAGENNKALALASELLIEDDSPDLYYKRSAIYKKLGKSDLAKIDFERARKIETELMGSIK